MKSTWWPLCLLAWSCGEEPVGISIRGVVTGLASVEIYFFDGRGSCETVAALNPRLSGALYGPHVVEVDASNNDGPRLSRSDIASGSYIIWVDGKAASGQLIATGCTPGQRIEDQRLSRIDVVLRPLGE